MVIIFKQNASVNLFKINIDRNELELVEDMRYLGTILDNKLKFGKMYNKLKKKVSKKINFNKRLDNKINKHSNNAIIIPHIAHHLYFWPTRIMRTILKCKMDAPVKDMLQSLNILSVK
jgi:hypothetical protein